MNPENRFKQKIQISTTHFYKGTPCWEWTATISPSGYGMFHYDGKMMPAHRFSYMFWKGKLNPDMDVDHLCRNRPCSNPDHLQQVPHKENVLRGMGLAAINKRKTHCKRGHEFTPENTIQGRNNARHCRECHKASVKKYEQSHTAQINRTKQKYRNNNKDRLNEAASKWRDRNKDRINQLARERWNENRDLANQKQREYRAKNKDKVNENRRAYYQLNKEKHLKKSLEYAKTHREIIEQEVNATIEEAIEEALRSEGIDIEKLKELTSAVDTIDSRGISNLKNVATNPQGFMENTFIQALTRAGPYGALAAAIITTIAGAPAMVAAVVQALGVKGAPLNQDYAFTEDEQMNQQFDRSVQFRRLTGDDPVITFTSRGFVAGDPDFVGNSLVDVNTSRIARVGLRQSSLNYIHGI